MTNYISCMTESYLSFQNNYTSQNKLLLAYKKQQTETRVNKWPENDCKLITGVCSLKYCQPQNENQVRRNNKFSFKV